MKGRRFTAEVETPDRFRTGAIRLPFDPKDVFGRARAPVQVTIRDRDSFRTTIAVYDGIGWIGLRKAQMSEFRLQPGETIKVRVDLDVLPREVELPEELTSTFESSPDAQVIFQGLSFTHRKEYARWVAEAKREQTRTNRATKAVEMLRKGTRTPG